MIILRTRGEAALSRTAAWSVHLLTASGAVWGLLALEAVASGRFRVALGWLGVALVVDSIDGALARAVRVKDVLPQIDGALLDNLVDYLNYVVVPAALVHRAGLLPDSVTLAGAALMLLTSAFQFTHRGAKTAEHFRGFPSCWNFVAAYLLLLDLDPTWAFAWILALSILALAPVRFVYPSRMRRLRGLTIALGAASGIAVGIAVALHPQAPRALVFGSLLFPLYYLTLGLAATRSR